MNFFPNFLLCNGIATVSYALVRNLENERAIYVNNQPISVLIYHSSFFNIHWNGGGIIYTILSEDARLRMKAVCFRECTTNGGNGIASYSGTHSLQEFILVSILLMKAKDGNDCIYTLNGTSTFTDFNNTNVNAYQVTSISSNSQEFIFF